MANPTAKEVTVTRYVCGACGNDHGSEQRAESCCMCDDCGKDLAAHKHSYLDDLCRRCYRKKERARLTGAISRLEDRVRTFYREITVAENSIKQYQRDLEQLDVDAPPSRQKKQAAPKPTTT